jgi:putative RecB family exonuclease
MIAALEPVAAVPQSPPPSARITELQRTVSASRLGLWLNCRLKFYFRYVLQLRKVTTAAMHAGITVHAVLQQWNLGRWRREPFATERFKQLFEAKWQSPRDEAGIPWENGEEETERAAAWRALEHYFTETPIRDAEKPEAVEVAAEADLSAQGLPTIIGVLDLVRAGGRIVDFKLVGKTPDPELLPHLHELQLTIYSLLYRDATGRKESGLELHHLVRTKQPKLILTSLPPATEQQHTRLFRLIESYQGGLAREDFVPSPGFGCASCEFLAECRAWQGKARHA